ncbi:MAG: response regulator [Magnetococcus sp. THC-1_WYH]
MKNETCRLTILLIEDEASHAFLIRKNLRRGGFGNEIIVIDSGQEAMNFLFSEGNNAGKPLPNPMLVLLDLNMPGVNGYQILQRMKSDPSTREIPIIVLTTTDDQREINKCYELGCNMYVTKPVEHQAFMEAVRELGLLFCIMTPPERL